MAGKDSIQILRGNNIGSSSQTLLAGQPLYDLTTHYLRIGDGGAISATEPIKASYANSADSANTASRLATSSVGNANRPVYFEDGVPVACCTNMNINIAGVANQARYLYYSAGSNYDPVYIASNGKAVSCSGNFVFANTTTANSVTIPNTVVNVGGCYSESTDMLVLQARFYANGKVESSSANWVDASSASPSPMSVSSTYPLSVVYAATVTPWNDAFAFVPSTVQHNIYRSTGISDTNSSSHPLISLTAKPDVSFEIMDYTQTVVEGRSTSNVPMIAYVFANSVKNTTRALVDANTYSSIGEKSLSIQKGVRAHVHGTFTWAQTAIG